jgi:hypothetical protein
MPSSRSFATGLAGRRTCAGAHRPFRPLTAWFEGSWDSANTRDEFAGTIGDKVLGATIAGGTASGSITAAGTESLFVAELVEGNALSGLFQVAERGCRTGFIVPPEERGEPQGVYCAETDAAGRPIVSVHEQVTPILPMRLTDRGIAIRLLRETEERVLYVTAVTLPLDSF